MTKVIYTGTIRNKQDGMDYSYNMCMLDLNHKAEILYLQHNVLSALENPETCVYLTEDEVKEILEGSGEIIGIYINDRLVAFGATLIPGEREDNLGRDIGMPYSELLKVAHLEFALVHQNYRGNSFQKRIAKCLVNRIIHDGGCRYLMNTISPYNPVSLDTDFYLGLRIKKLCNKYGNLLRYILYSDITISQKTVWDSIISVPVSQLEKQSSLLEQGYEGFGFEDGVKSGKILFGKVKKQ